MYLEKAFMVLLELYLRLRDAMLRMSRPASPEKGGNTLWSKIEKNTEKIAIQSFTFPRAPE